ncbi:MBL fold metallo-hydrolase [Cellvibrio polysaccharolyticus]|uniref:MBL fold metallo-hydrolase n=1 Tax=Cellvibrio polysaccharolyticus TaxID=2082724 RepID=A0A928V643_9GAMM|nr:MBL fold metallo-hydrolase [Cellvibrio polysaccharolyticus]MBE8716779.1 MBL fold metallo-hydrolase [Cellvibrio polysaccharolyticus]
MRFASLGSGSRGNATLVEWPGGTLLIDCGFSVREAESRLQRLGQSPASLSAILVTHEHIDHIKGVAAFARRYQLPVYMTPGTWQSRDFGVLPDLRLLETTAPFMIGDLLITPIAVPHDAREPVQFILQHEQRRLGLLTDLGSIPPHVESAYQTCHALILEANHDSTMLASGPYPASLKRRVGGQWGHLNNQQAVGFLQRLDISLLQHLVIAHISQKNNSPDLVRQAFSGVVAAIAEVTYACQDEGFGWLVVR